MTFIDVATIPSPNALEVHINMRFLHMEVPLWTNIEIDDQLVSKAMRSSGARTKKAPRTPEMWKVMCPY